MNNQVPTERGEVPEFINLEEYNNLLGELEHLESSQLTLSELTIKLELPEIITETAKMISNIFYRTTTDRYLKHCILSSLTADIDIFLRHHKSYERLFYFLEKLNQME